MEILSCFQRKVCRIMYFSDCYDFMYLGSCFVSTVNFRQTKYNNDAKFEDLLSSRSEHIRIALIQVLHQNC